MLQLYGIPNCDSVQKAMKFLRTNTIPFRFHDFKKEQLTKEKIGEWCEKIPVEQILNKRSTTWKLLSDDERIRAETLSGAVALMAAYNNLLKRPVTEISGIILTGFNPTIYSKYLQHG